MMYKFHIYSNGGVDFRGALQTVACSHNFSVQMSAETILGMLYCFQM